MTDTFERRNNAFSKAQVDTQMAYIEAECEVKLLRDIVRGMQLCDIEDADAHDCPLYDEDEPNRCKKDRLLRELGLVVEG